ncbi:MAG: hypothetical protein LBG65_04015 [Puniceicoccales bacterium]|nr:hypothetical protein [Puniceicoccales bacterium]
MSIPPSMPEKNAGPSRPAGTRPPAPRPPARDWFCVFVYAGVAALLLAQFAALLFFDFV